MARRSAGKKSSDSRTADAALKALDKMGEMLKEKVHDNLT